MEIHDNKQRDLNSGATTVATGLMDPEDTITTRADFINFARDLVRDLRQDRSRWENDSLELYLEAIASWVEDMDGFYMNNGQPVPSEPSWTMLGQILLAAKFYE